MRLAQTDVIADIPAPKARELMRLFRVPRHADLISQIVPTDLRPPEAIAAAFADLGYLQLTGRSPEGGWWEATIAGNALANARFTKPITRSTADRLLAAVVDRAGAYNDDPRHILRITEILVFGSYLDPSADSLGDLDIAVTWIRLGPDAHEQYSEYALAYARASGRRFDSFVDELQWAEIELVRTLKARSSAISITSDDIRSLTGAGQWCSQLRDGRWILDPAESWITAQRLPGWPSTGCDFGGAIVERHTHTLSPAAIVHTFR